MSLKSSCWMGLVMVGALLRQAQAFTPIKPPESCVNVKARVLYIRASDDASDVVMKRLAAGGIASTTATQVEHHRTRLANSWVDQLALYIDRFQAEAKPRLSWGVYPDGFVIRSGSTAAMNAPAWVSIDNYPWSFQSRPGVVELTTNGESVSGALIETVQACSTLDTPNTDSPAVLVPQVRNKGLLLGTGDVVTVRLPAPKETNMHQTISMWEDDQSNNFDLYASCGGTADASAPYRDTTTSVGFLHLPPCGAGWQLSVVSQRGLGGFNLVLAHHRPEHHFRLRVGAAGEFVRPDQAQGIVDSIQKGALYFFGTTEGEQYIEAIDFHPNQRCICAGQACHVCYHNTRETHPELAGTVKDSRFLDGAQATGFASASNNDLAHV